ncbi:hypothetical protein Dimus_028092 [Dionaea muscipula]
MYKTRIKRVLYGYIIRHFKNTRILLTEVSGMSAAYKRLVSGMSAAYQGLVSGLQAACQRLRLTNGLSATSDGLSARRLPIFASSILPVTSLLRGKFHLHQKMGMCPGSDLSAAYKRLVRLTAAYKRHVSSYWRHVDDLLSGMSATSERHVGDF